MVLKINNKPQTQKIKIGTLQVITSNNNTSNGSPKPPKRGRQKIAAIIGVITTFCTISGLSVSSVYKHVCANPDEGSISETIELSGTGDSSDTEESSGTGELSGKAEPPKTNKPHSTTESMISTEPSKASESSGTTNSEEYKIYLYSEYSKITIYSENNITATLNFEAEEVSITAYLASGGVDRLYMNRRNSTEWGKKVIFNETGIHKIVAVAVAPNGEEIKGSTEVEVIDINIGDFNFDQLFQFSKLI